MSPAAAFGFRLSGLTKAEWLGVRGVSHWPELNCRTERSPDAPELSLDAAALELRVRCDVAHSELVHPLLGRVASHIALTHGADGMHAGAVAGPAGAWAVIGPKGAGKSTLLAGLARVGVPIVTDDILVFRAGAVMAGPRCIDLRPDVKGFGFGVAVRPTDPRNRIALPPIGGEHQLVGVIHLQWSLASATLQPLDHREAIQRLLILRSDKGYPHDPQRILDLAALPTFVLKRPRSFTALDASVELVQVLLSESADSRRTA
jgi:hypothetical protein